MSLRSSLRTEGISVRSIFTFVLVVAITALFWATFGSFTPANAQEATWNGEALQYDGKQFLRVGESVGTESHKIPAESVYYTHVEEITPDNAANSRTKTHKAHVIYFAPGADPPVETSASYVVYDYNPTTKVFSNPSTAQTVTVSNTATAQQPTTCAIEGVGWIVCQVSTFLAQGMDWVFSVLTGFMEVQPVNVSNKDSDLYIAWDVMRNIANVAFIIAFTIIIYSQLTSVGLSNYNLKKMLPRLIISAILVNMSFIIAAIAVDISNIFGYSLQDIFLQIRNSVFNIDNNTWGSSVTNWQSVTGFVISGGTAALAGAIGVSSLVISAGGTITGAIFLLLPALVGLLLAVLVVLLILAARQAIIVILIIIAPLAFVAYLLPNTEKWFDKWKDIFMTMLIFFPAFSVVFGGSQLAGAVIIQNATSINVMILGMIVQVAPLVITPLILKFSGNLLGKIAGIVNNPNRGLIDRTRKWADGHREYHRMRGMSGMRYNGKPGELRALNGARKFARMNDRKRRNLEARTKNAAAHLDNNYSGSSAHRKLHESAHEVDLDKKRIDADNEKHIQQSTNVRGGKFYIKNLDVESMQTELEVEKARTQKVTDEYRSGRMVIEEPGEDASRTERREATNLSMLASRMSRSSIELAAEARAGVAAKQAQQQNYAESLKLDGAIKAMAGGIDPNGEQRALADAISIISKNRKETIENAKVIIDHHNLTENEKIDIISGRAVRDIAPTADIILAAQSMLNSSSPATVLKALEQIDYTSVPGLSADDIEELYAGFGSTIGDPSNKLRPAFFDFGTAGKIKLGTGIDGQPISGPIGEEGLNKLAIKAINDKKSLSPDALQGMFPPYIDVIVRSLEANRNDPNPANRISEDAQRNLRETMELLLDPTRDGYDRLTGESKDKFKAILRQLEQY